MTQKQNANVERAKKEIGVVWTEYQQVTPVRLRFGQVCYEWQQKLKTTEMAAVWQELHIPEKEALREMESYLESIGQERLHIEKRTNREEPDEFEDIRKVALSMLALGHKELQKTDVKLSLLDSAKTWAGCKLKEKEHEHNETAPVRQQ
jgi:hypothetical protein